MTSKPTERDNIQVSIRIKPMLEESRSCIRLDQNLKNTIIIDANNQQEQKYFYFDYVANSEAQQEDIFEVIGKQQAINCLEGYNGCVFVYGQTGSGKTYTMMGTQKYPGLLPRVIEYLFNCIYQDQSESVNVEYLLKCSYLEIYNEHIIDLLNPQSGNLQMREDLKKGVYVEYLSEESCTNVNECLEIMARGNTNRHISSTNMNIESSRSHSVFTIQVESRRQSTQTQVINHRFSRFHFVDLAGSERQKQSQVQGDRLREGCNINRSLHILGNVINALVDDSQQNKYVHYRDSKLTFLLKDSLGGNSRTHLIANIQQSVQYYQETLSTLMFSKRVKQVKNKARINEDDSGNLESLKNEIKRLKQELARNIVQSQSWESPRKQEQKSILQSEQFLHSLELEGMMITDQKYIKLEEILKCYLEQSTESETALYLELEKYLGGMKQLKDAFSMGQILEQELRLIIKLQNDQIQRLKRQQNISEQQIPSISIDQPLLNKIFLENIQFKESNSQNIPKAQFQVEQNITLLKDIVETVNNSLQERKNLQNQLDSQFNSQYVAIEKFKSLEEESNYKEQLLSEQTAKIVKMEENQQKIDCQLQAELSNHQAEIDQLKETCEQLYRQCEEYSEELSKKQEESNNIQEQEYNNQQQLIQLNDKLKEQIVNKENQINQQIEKLNTIMQQYEELQLKNEELEQFMNQQKLMLIDEQRINKNLNSQNEELQNNLKEFDNQLQQLQQEMKEQNDDLLRQNQELTDENKDLTNFNKELSNQINQQNEINQQQNLQQDKLQNTLINQNNELQDVYQELQLLKQTIQEYENNQITLKGENNDQQSILLQLQQNYDKLKQENNNINNQYQELQNQYLKQQEQLLEIEEQNNELLKENQEILLENQTQQNQLKINEQDQDQIKQLQIQIQNLQQQLNQSESNNKLLQQQQPIIIEQYEIKIKENNENNTKQIQEYQDSIQDHKKTIQQLNQYYQERELEFQSTLESLTNDLQREKEIKQRQIESFENKISKLELLKKELDDKYLNIVNIKNEKELLIQQLQMQIQYSSETSSSAKQTLQLQINELNKDIMTKDREIEILSSQLQESQQIIQEMGQMNNTLQSNLDLIQKQLESKQALIQETAENFNHVHQQYQGLSQQNEQLQQELKTKINQEQGRIMDLNQKLQNKAKQLEQAVKENESFKEMNQNLEEQNNELQLIIEALNKQGKLKDEENAKLVKEKEQISAILEKETECLEQENVQLKEQINKLQNEQEDQSKEMNKLECQIPLLQDILKQKTSQIENLVDQLTQYEFKVQSGTQSQQELVRKHQSELQQLRRDLENKLEDNRNQSRREYQELSNELQKQMEQKEKEMNQFKEKGKSDVMKYHKIIQGLENQNNILKNQIEEYYNRLEDMNQKCQTYELQISENQDKFQLLKEQCHEQLIKENSELKMKIDKKQSTIHQLEQALMSNEETLKNVHEKAKEFCKMQEKEINDIKEQYLKLEAEHNSIMSQNQEKEDEIEITREQKEQALMQINEYRGCEQRLRKEIQELQEKLIKSNNSNAMLNKQIDEMYKDIQQLGGHANQSQKIKYLNQIKQENSTLKQEKLYLSEQLQKEIEEKNKLINNKQEFGKVDIPKLIQENQRITNEMQKLNQILNLTGVKNRYSAIKGSEGDKIIQSVQLLIQELIDCKQEIQQRNKEQESKNIKYQTMEKDLLLMKQKYFARDNKASSPTHDHQVLKDTRNNYNNSASRQVKNKQTFQFQ